MAETSRISPNVSNLSMPRGKLSFYPLNDNGVATGGIDLGNVTTLDITNAVGYKDHMTSHDSVVVLDAKKITEQKWTVKFTPEERSKENMAMWLLGDPDKQKGAGADLESQTGTTVSAQATVIYLDRWIDLGKKYIKSGSIIMASTALTAFTAGTYRVDYEAGRIMILSTNTESITNGASVNITYKYGTVALPKFVARSRPLIGMLMYIGLSENGPRHMVTCWKVQITPDAAANFIKTQDYAGLSFSGDIFIDDDSGAHPTQPFFSCIELSEASSYPS